MQIVKEKEDLTEVKKLLKGKIRVTELETGLHHTKCVYIQLGMLYPAKGEIELKVQYFGGSIGITSGDYTDNDFQKAFEREVGNRKFFHQKHINHQILNYKDNPTMVIDLNIDTDRIDEIEFFLPKKYTGKPKESENYFR